MSDKCLNKHWFPPRLLKRPGYHMLMSSPRS